MTVFKKSDYHQPSFSSNDAELSFLRGVMRRSLDMVAILDKNGYYKYISPAAIDILGYQPDQIIGKSFREFVDKGIIEIDGQIFNKLLETKEQVTVDFWMTKADGKKMLLQNLAINLLDDPNVEGILFNGRDITDLFYTKKSLDRKFELESLLANCSTKFVNSVYTNLDEAFLYSLKNFSSYFKAKKSYIYRVSSDKKDVKLLYKHGEDLDQIPTFLSYELLTDVLVDEYSDGIIYLEKGYSDSVCHKLMGDLSELFLESNHLIIPILVGNQLSGFFGFTDFADSFDWEVKDLLVLKQLGDIFSGAFVNLSIKKRLDRNENLLINTEILAKSGSWRFSENQKKVVITPGFKDLFQISSNDLNLSVFTALRLIPELDRSKFLQKIKKVSTSGSIETGEFVIQSIDGDCKYIKFHIQSKIYQNLNLRELYGYFVDITDVHKSKEQILKSEEKFRTLVEDSTEIIFSLKPDLTIIYLSPNVEQFLGFESSKVIGTKLTQYMHSSDLEAFEEFLKIDEHFLLKNQYLEFKLRTKENDFKAFSSNAKVVYSSDGEFLYNGIARDVTKLREAQKELVFAKERAEMAAKAKSQFLSIMSHEIRTPMNAVIGLTHLLIEENPRSDQLENLKTLQFSAENLLSLINNILDFNKMESGKLEIEYVPIDLKNLINTFIMSYKYQAREKDLQILFEFDERISSNLLGDAVRVGQIINNLLSNAIKFTEKGFIRVSVKLKTQKSDGLILDFLIEDTGIGIPDDKIKDIFNAFTQASTETTRKFGGTGLGLAIVKKLIQLFDSEIHVDSQENKGTSISFPIFFPFGSSTTTSLSSPINQLEDNLKEARLLIAEDNIVNQMMVRKFMKKWGVDNFTIVNDGQEAIEMLDCNIFDILLLDLQMPRKDGLEVVKFVRSHSKLEIRNLPIIAMTASPWEEVMEKFENLKMDDYVPKPFNPESLYLKLIRHLQT
ncbi:PAS domain S-box protein [Mongoliitalea lutea]|uniref:histidine kinase n=1 Tax=Mongoliitalea lutea TaxID=849756 RepID=A0A8J3CVT7_9BACT|nr:PAS domain S-box protein [Mongoliitalea lutea]GHB26988.1 hypothetical protein GCM10008106_04640 [Mongoliitalea lutea]